MVDYLESDDLYFPQSPSLYQPLVSAYAENKGLE